MKTLPESNEPVAWNDENVIAYCLKRGIEAAKHVAPQRQPLTDEQINDVCVETYLKNEQPFATNLDAFKAIARAIEAAHGIKE